MNVTAKFNLDLPGIANALGVDVEMMQRKIALDVYSELVQRTPVDTGRARAGWSVDTRHGSYVPKPDLKTYQKPFADIPKGAPLIVIYNNVDYIIRLNEGYSQQAPALFVEQAVERVMGGI